MRTRLVIFYGLFAVILLICAILVSLYYASPTLSAEVARYFFTVAPLMQEQAPFATMMWPMILAAVGGVTAPSARDRRHFFAILLLAAVTWLSYLHLGTILVSEGTAQDPSRMPTAWRKEMGALDVPPDEVISLLISFASGVRDLAAIVVAVVLGLAVNGQGRPQQNALATDVSPAAPFAGKPERHPYELPRGPP